MTRKKKWGIAILLSLIALLVAAVAFMAGARAGGPQLVDQLAMAEAPKEAADTAEPIASKPVYTPPPLQPAVGWPFEPLPRIAKFTRTLPEVELANTFSDYLHSPEIRSLPVAASAAPVSRSPSVAWVLPPLAAAGGLALGSRESSWGGSSVVPEPGTILLLATGLLILGLIVVRRRRKAGSATTES